MNRLHLGRAPRNPFWGFSFKQAMPSSPWPGGRAAAGRARTSLAALVFGGLAFSVPAPTTSVPPPARPVLEVGDSLGIDLGWGLTDELSSSRHRLIAVAVGDTGLAEPSYYDWPAQLAVDLRSYHPGTVVVFLGANDVESFYTSDRFLAFGSPGWAAFYGKRVAKMMNEAVSAGAKLLWVGMPPMEDPSFSSDMATLNAVYRAEAISHRPDVSYLASWRVLGGPQGQYKGAVTGPEGDEVALRAPDGAHITRAGGDLLAKAVVARLKRFGWL
jgi:peptidoglycan endopeptidase LytF